MKKIMVVFGTRPEAIKMCPLVKELKRHKECQILVCVTGQHREMLEQVLKVFDIIPDYDLKIMKEGQTLFDITTKVLLGMKEILEQVKPEIVLVHGDTTSALAASMAAFYLEIPIGHVEAGLRTYDIGAPYPEEFNRQGISIIAKYNFAPTAIAANNLLREGKKESSIFITGNTVIDALATTVKEDFKHPLLEWAKDSRLILLTAHRRENLGEPLYSMFRGIKKVLDEVPDIKIIYPIHKNSLVREAANEIFGNHTRMKIVEPLDVIEFHNIMNQSYLILTDSGGIQEEAPALGKPVLVMRNTTERPEGVEAGTLRLIGTKGKGIYDACMQILTDKSQYNSMSKASNPYGDGTASKKIAEILLPKSPISRVLIGSPVYQKPEILREFLESLQRLKSETIEISYLFVDDNKQEESKQILHQFAEENEHVMIFQGEEQEDYICNQESHYWSDSLMLKVANYKNRIIQYAIKEQYDYLFLADSDLVLHPNLIEHLKTLDKDIVSEIFWCSWHTGEQEFPNVWMFDEYDIVPKRAGEILDEKESQIRQEKFLDMLRVPGVYEVGGLGACTLLKIEALKKGVDFSPIKNLTIHGEDRFFCIRAIVLGINLFVDTHYPAYHIYREADIDGVSAYVKQAQQEAVFVRTKGMVGNKITVSMIVKNEEKRYLKQVLERLRGHIDAAVIIDDGSTDHTVEICREMLSGIPLYLYKNEKSMFETETVLRQKQWEKTIATNPDWILNIDADELLEEKFWEEIQECVENKDVDVYCFKLYDMWNEKQYREDTYWNAHTKYRPFMVRYQSNFHYTFRNTPQHCGRFPMNIDLLPTKNAEGRIKHLGWMTKKDRISKYERYRRLDPNAVYGIKEQYESIMDENPILEDFQL